MGYYHSMNHESFPLYSQSDREPILPTESLLLPATRKIAQMFHSIYNQNVPSGIQERFNELKNNSTQHISIDQSIDGTSFSSNDPNSRDVVGYMDPETDIIHLPNASRESTVIHEMFHFLSSNPSTKHSGFHYHNVLWTKYLNEAFTEFLTFNTIRRDVHGVLKPDANSDNAQRGIEKYLTRGYDPYEEKTESYRTAYDTLLDTVTYIPSDKKKDVMIRFIDSYFSQNLDGVIDALSLFTYTDYTDFDKRKGPPIKRLVSEFLHESFENIALHKIETWKDHLDHLPLTTNLFSTTKERSEYAVIQKMVRLITQQSKDTLVDVHILFSDNIKQRKGIQTDMYSNNLSSFILISTDLLDASKYLILSNTGVFWEAYRLLLLEQAATLAQHSIIFNKKDVQNAMSSVISRIDPNQQKTVDVLRQLLQNDPGNPRHMDMIRSILGIDDIFSMVIDDGIEKISSIRQVGTVLRRYKNKH